MKLNTLWRVSAVVVAVVCAVLIGCSEKKETPPAPTPEPGPPAEPQAPGPLGEPKFSLSINEFIAEYLENSREADKKYFSTVVELSGTASLATVELNADGVPVGKPGHHKATFTLSEPNAKRHETVIVRGLSIATIGKVLEGQKLKVKGKVAKHQRLQPVEMLFAEVVDFGADAGVPVTVAELTASPAELTQLAKKCEGRSAVVKATIANRLTEGDREVIEIETPGEKVKCYLANGIATVFTSGLEKGKQVTLAGTLKLNNERIKDDTKDEIKWWIEMRDCVPVNLPAP
ncbi:MAG: hypothetical protein L0241_29070 [Planctomycetia bacterium]|nr:hypothetical protein [Planctomycetia bacterium]